MSGMATRANCSKRCDSVLAVRSGERAAANLNPTQISLDMDGSEHEMPIVDMRRGMQSYHLPLTLNPIMSLEALNIVAGSNCGWLIGWDEFLLQSAFSCFFPLFFFFLLDGPEAIIVGIVLILPFYHVGCALIICSFPCFREYHAEFFYVFSSFVCLFLYVKFLKLKSVSFGDFFVRASLIKLNEDVL
ncbi:hypothetical protein Dimus_029339 [Dionaea muscipula]